MFLYSYSVQLLYLNIKRTHVHARIEEMMIMRTSCPGQVLYMSISGFGNLLKVSAVEGRTANSPFSF